MTRFLDVRLWPVGGDLAASVAIHQTTDTGDYPTLDLAQLQMDIRGRHVLIGTHGFNVNRAAGIDSLSNWETLLQLPSPSIFVGLLWPGDSIWLHGLDYPDEPRIADQAGQMIAEFLDDNFTGAASISFASHSLGARVVLETISRMNLGARRLTLMAPAIDDDCLDTEFQTAAASVGEISVLASQKDTVLSGLFPLGNLAGGILTAGHPWWHAALGREGPSNPRPGNFHAPFEIPGDWDFNHGNYLQVNHPQVAVVPVPVDVPPEGTPQPANSDPGWQEAWSAAYTSSRFR